MEEKRQFSTSKSSVKTVQSRHNEKAKKNSVEVKEFNHTKTVESKTTKLLWVCQLITQLALKTFENKTFRICKGLCILNSFYFVTDHR